MRDCMARRKHAPKTMQASATMALVTRRRRAVLRMPRRAGPRRRTRCVLLAQGGAVDLTRGGERAKARCTKGLRQCRRACSYMGAAGPLERACPAGEKIGVLAGLRWSRQHRKYLEKRKVDEQQGLRRSRLGLWGWLMGLRRQLEAPQRAPSPRRCVVGHQHTPPRVRISPPSCPPPGPI